MRPPTPEARSFGDALGGFWAMVPEVVRTALLTTIKLAVIVVAARLLLRVVPFLERKVTERAARTADRGGAETTDAVNARQRIATLARVTTSATRVVVLGLAIVMALSQLGIDVQPLLAGAGIAGLAVGFGAQTIVKDFLSGFFALLENQYAVGETVTVNGVTGVVEEITLRCTMIRDATGALHYFTHGAITTVVNRDAGWLMATVDLSVPVDVAPDEARAALETIAETARTTAPLKGWLRGAVKVEGPLELKADSTTWRLVARSTPERVTEVRQALLAAVTTSLTPRTRESGLQWVRWRKAATPPDASG